MLDVVEPATGTTLAQIGYGTRSDAVEAADAASDAFPNWSESPARARARVLQRTAELLRDRKEEIGRVLARESGKLLAEAIAEIAFSAEYFQWFAEECRRPHGVTIPGEVEGRRHQTFTQACGVALCITPWNFPVSIQARKLAAALAAGCTVVSRPSDRAPLAVIELFACMEAAGLPPGVANLVHGPAREVTTALLDHPAVRVVSFTGSTGVGKALMAQASERIVRPALELGGNAPYIVFADADIDRAVDGAMITKFRNNGQSCIAANRFLVEAPAYDAFVEKLSERIGAMTLGDPMDDPTPHLGPLVEEKAQRAHEALMEEAERAGARRLTPELNRPERGYFVQPALYGDVPEDTKLASTEVFSPIAPVIAFEGEEEAVRQANATEMGLAGYLYTQDVSRATRVAEALEVGILGLNNPLPSVAFAPMGGVKQSGLGREGGHLGIDEFVETKYVCLDV